MSQPTEKNPKLFSIVTVVYNAVSLIEETLQSVMDQRSDELEYIVIDGGSTDGTLEIIDKYRANIDIFVCEKDRGIYDAMNKAIRLASGSYINFMNAGDRFYSNDTLEKVSSLIRKKGLEKVEIVYGKVVKISSLEGNFQYEIGEPLTPNSFFLTTPICHQAMFTRTDLFGTLGGYSLEYRVGSFFAWLGKYYHSRQSLDGIYFIPERVAYYLVGGFSFKMKKTIDLERLQVSRKYFNFKYRLLNHLVVYFIKLPKANLLPLMEKYKVLDGYRKVKYTLLGKGV
jgi:glycosyltransferase involved in cell wall biosynthesis